MKAPISAYLPPPTKSTDSGSYSSSASKGPFGASTESLLKRSAGDGREKGAFYREVAINEEYNLIFGVSLEEPGGKPATTIQSAEQGRRATKNYTPDPTTVYKRAANNTDSTEQKDSYKPYERQYKPDYKGEEANDSGDYKVISIIAALERKAKGIDAIYGALVPNKKPKAAVSDVKTEPSRYKLRIQGYNLISRKYENESGVSYSSSSLEKRLRRRKSTTSTGTIDDLFDKAA